MILQVLHADKKTEEEKGKKGRITIDDEVSHSG
jgi:hypothetical protein